MSLYTLRDVLTEQLRDLYDAETQYNSMVPRLTDAASNQDLRSALTAIGRQTGANAQRLADVCRKLNVNPEGVPCEAMKGLVRESQHTAKDDGDANAIDAAIIANAQRIAHYEIAGFGTAKAFASQLNEPEIADDLDDLLSEAWIADSALTRIATGGRNGNGINGSASEA
jgi:ferritin-like metal-binding protein YciE